MITFSTILQGSEATEENAINFALGFDFSEDETEETTIAHSKYIDTKNGIDIYYNYCADYYFFAPEEDEQAINEHNYYAAYFY
jgi:hypothetical protein